MCKTRPWLTGKPKLDPAVRRDKLMSINLTNSQYDDLKVLAEIRGFKPAGLVYKLVSKQLQDNAEIIQAYREAHDNFESAGIM